MSKQKKSPGGNSRARIGFVAQVRVVDSLLDQMQEGNEYGSIVSVAPRENFDLLGEVSRALEAISTIRRRPCISYLGNVVRRDEGDSGIDPTDDLPFIEMVRSVPATDRKVDVLLSTRGGSAHQVSRFVNCLRARFDEVDFLIPSFCMSAGTLFALSGDHIWMTPQACLGPIDPQIPTREGRYVPAQALLLLVSQLQQQGQASLSKGQSVPWTAVRIIDSIDKKELGDAITASHYSTMMASQFLLSYKFQHWTTRETTGTPVTSEYRQQRATEVGTALASHDRWKNHGHAISRDVLWTEIKLKIDHPDAALERALVRAWALLNWIFEKTPVFKLIVAPTYRYSKYSIRIGGTS